MASARLKGHALQHEGKPFERGEETPWRRAYGYPGMALCECGEVSGVLDSDSARKAWHRDIHKPQVRARREADGG